MVRPEETALAVPDPPLIAEMKRRIQAILGEGVNLDFREAPKRFAGEYSIDGTISYFSASVLDLERGGEGILLSVDVWKEEPVDSTKPFTVAVYAEALVLYYGDDSFGDCDNYRITEETEAASTLPNVIERVLDQAMSGTARLKGVRGLLEVASAPTSGKADAVATARTNAAGTSL